MAKENLDGFRCEKIDYYDYLSRVKALEDKEIKSFKDELDSKLTTVSNLKFNTSIVNKLIHPFRTIKNSINYKELSKVKEGFDKRVNECVLELDDAENADLDEDLQMVVDYKKPNMIKKYIKSQRMTMDRIK